MMKKFTRLIVMILVLSLTLAIPANAESTVEPRSSVFFAAYSTSLQKTGTYSFRIWFEVDANASVSPVDVLGASEIIVYRSADKQTWTRVRTFTMDDYPQMTDYNTGSFAGYVTNYNSTPGYYYRAYVFFYAKNSSGVGERDVYTGILKM